MRRNNRRNNQFRKKSKIIRCKAHNKPVFEHEVCSSFIEKIKTNEMKNCENCKHSF